MEMRPTKAEKSFLSLGYNRFYDLYEEIMSDAFWEKEASYRFTKASNAFAVYTELLSYEPFKYVLEAVKRHRPPMESEIGGPLFKVVRNILSHFPFYDTWNDVWVNKELINWRTEGLTIDQFLKKYAGHEEVKYRLWDAKKGEMTYLSIRFPAEYAECRIYLKDIMSEEDGVKFSLVMMRKILDTQVESVGEKA